jgi:hypothetical protein
MYAKPEIVSSYAKNDLGRDLYNLIRRYKPTKIFDFGILNGYSTIAMAQAVRDIYREEKDEKELRKIFDTKPRKPPYTGQVYACDIFDAYEYNSADKNVVKSNIQSYDLQELVTVLNLDFKEWIQTTPDFDFLHLDISNDGNIIEYLWNHTTFQRLADPEKQAIVVFEGGSLERDQVEWMNKYEKRPIRQLKDLSHYVLVNEAFPSLSMFPLTIQ